MFKKFTDVITRRLNGASRYNLFFMGFWFCSMLDSMLRSHFPLALVDLVFICIHSITQDELKIIKSKFKK